jgi:hypothetical protein
MDSSLFIVNNHNRDCRNRRKELVQLALPVCDIETVSLLTVLNKHLKMGKNNTKNRTKEAKRLTTRLLLPRSRFGPSGNCQDLKRPLPDTMMALYGSHDDEE